MPRREPTQRRAQAETRSKPEPVLTRVPVQTRAIARSRPSAVPSSTVPSKRGPIPTRADPSANGPHHGSRTGWRSGLRRTGSNSHSTAEREAAHGTAFRVRPAKEPGIRAQTFRRRRGSSRHRLEVSDSMHRSPAGRGPASSQVESSPTDMAVLRLRRHCQLCFGSRWRCQHRRPLRAHGWSEDQHCVPG
jgi:hypothetical protein